MLFFKVSTRNNFLSKNLFTPKLKAPTRKVAHRKTKYKHNLKY